MSVDFGGRSLVVNRRAKPRQERPQGGRPRNDRRY